MDQTTYQQPMRSFSEPKKSRLWFVILIIVALVVVAGVLYLSRSEVIPQYMTEVSDDVTAIEADLQATNLDDLGSELSDIDKELAQ